MRRLLALTFIGLLLGTSAHADTTVPLDHIAVVVNDSAILQSAVEKRMADVRYRFEQNHAPLPADDVLRKQVVDQMILENLQLAEAEQNGIKVDDATLSGALTDIAKQNNLTLAQFQQQLDHTPGSSYAEVREQVKHEIMISRLRQRVMQKRINITDQDVQNFLKSPQGKAELASEYHLAHIMVGLPEAATPLQIDEAKKKADTAVAELKAGHDFAQVAATYSNADTALKGGDLGWRKAAQLPTIFAGMVDKMQVGDLAGPVRTASGFHIIKLLDKRGDTMTVTQYHVRHILIKPSEILSSEDAHQEISDIRDKIIAKKADFAEMARIHSDDPGSARNGGDLDWVNPGEMVPEFEKVMDATAVGTVSEPFQSSFGWHILEVLGKRDQDMSSQYRNGLAREALRSRQYDEELASWLRELRASAYVDIKDPADK